jgi:hypothetical protein
MANINISSITLDAINFPDMTVFVRGVDYSYDVSCNLNNYEDIILHSIRDVKDRERVRALALPVSMIQRVLRFFGYSDLDSNSSLSKPKVTRLTILGYNFDFLLTERIRRKVGSLNRLELILNKDKLYNDINLPNFSTLKLRNFSFYHDSTAVYDVYSSTHLKSSANDNIDHIVKSYFLLRKLTALQE